MRERTLQLAGLERESGLPAQEVEHGDAGLLSRVGPAMHAFALGDAKGFGLRAGALTGQDAFLDNFMELITNQKNDPQLLEAYNSLIHKYNEAALLEVKKHKELIKNWLKTDITARYHGQRGRIEASLNSDPTIAKAIHLFNNPKEYQSALDGTHPGCLNKKP